MVFFLQNYLAYYIYLFISQFFSDPLDEVFDVKELKDIWECWKLLKKDKSANLTYHDIRATELRQNWKYYHFYYMGANTIFGHFLPFVLLVVLNILIMWTLRKNKQSSIGKNAKPKKCRTSSC